MADNADDERHVREEAERRAKRKAAKQQKSDAQRHAEEKRRAYRQKILEQHGQQAASARPGQPPPPPRPPSGSSHHRKPKPSSSKGDTAVTSTGAFQALFTQRAQGFQIDFRFRNAPPRPPVGPCFVGDTLQQVILNQCRQYKPFNAVEMNHVWKLHAEPDLGVPLAPSAMDIKSYEKPRDVADLSNIQLHADDLALLEWKGSMGDTAADQRLKRQEAAHAAARQWLQGPIGESAKREKKVKKKQFSRVLKEEMQTWMKKTTYLSNDYSRRVHDFKSLAQTKQELATDLHAKQMELAQGRTLQAVTASFNIPTNKLQHPTNKKLKPTLICPLIPNVDNWGRAFTHVVIDKAPNSLPAGVKVSHLSKKGTFVSNVNKSDATTRMTCQLMAPRIKDENFKNKNVNTEEDLILPVQALDLDVIPLKEEDAPHMNFCFWVDTANGMATYLPISSRIQLSTGRPIRKAKLQIVERRPLTGTELDELEERAAEVDRDLAEKHHIEMAPTRTHHAGSKRRRIEEDDDDSDGGGKDDDGEGDFGADDSDSENEQVFGGGTKTTA